jgi:hypothetical protein
MYEKARGEGRRGWEKGGQGRTGGEGRRKGRRMDRVRGRREGEEDERERRVTGRGG